MKPVKILLFVLVVFLFLAAATWLTPEKGVKWGDFTFHMPGLNDMFFAEKEKYTNVSDIVEQQFNIDSLVKIEEDSARSAVVKKIIIHKASYDSLVKTLTKIELNNAAGKNLQKFFNRLENDSLVRIMHYGDSQIEGDRITAFVRNKLQQKFGGTGPGLRPALQPYDYVFTANQENSGNWKRYPVYGDVDSTVQHNKYGVMAAYSRFAPLSAGSEPLSGSENHQAWLKISSSDISFLRTRLYKRLRFFYGNLKTPVYFKLLAGENTMHDTLNSGVDYQVISYDLPDSTESVSMYFDGNDSPDVYGIELGSKKGVIMDNIALRGSSGLIFTKNDFELSRKMYSDLNPALFILQFGGNVMPYITSEKAIKNYGNRFRKQIECIQQLCPDAAILVIGPSDMSVKEKEKYITYKHLPAVVDALQNAALSTGCGFWNMYEAMGGKNSMPSWVNAEPELARPDYTHFSARGARLVANMFYNALMLEYNNYLEEQQQVKTKVEQMADNVR